VDISDDNPDSRADCVDSHLDNNPAACSADRDAGYKPADCIALVAHTPAQGSTVVDKPVVHRQVAHKPVVDCTRQAVPDSKDAAHIPLAAGNNRNPHSRQRRH